MPGHSSWRSTWPSPTWRGFASAERRPPSSTGDRAAQATEQHRRRWGVRLMPSGAAPPDHRGNRRKRTVMREFHGRATARMAATPDAIFGLITDLDRLAEWNGAIEALVRRPADL